jgi:hypothetical protein
MKEHSLSRTRLWILTVGIIALLAGHGIVLYYVSSHIALSASLILGTIVLLMIKHVGLLWPLHALFRHRSGSDHRRHR